MPKNPNLNPSEHFKPKAPTGKPSAPPVNPEVIDIKGENIEGDVHIENDDLTPASFTDLMKDSSIGFFEYVMEFEEDHPWLFFIGVALILFVIIGGIVSFFFENKYSSDEVSTNENTPEISETIETEEETIEEPVKTETKAAFKGLNVALNITSEESYDQIVYKTNEGGFLTNELLMIRKMKAALNRDIQSEINDIKLDENSKTNKNLSEQELSDLEDINKAKLVNKREDHLREYLLELIDLEKEGSKKYQHLSDLLNNSSSELKQLNSKKTAASKNINDIFYKSGTNELSVALDKSLKLENEYDNIENELNITTQITNAYKEPLQLLQARIAAIRANKDLLIHNLQVRPIHDAGIEFIQNGKVDDWYKSSSQINEKINYSNTYKPVSGYTPTPTNNEMVTERAVDSVMRSPVRFRVQDIPSFSK